MALFIDGRTSTIEDLTAQDSQLLDVASIEGIDVTQKLDLASTEIGLELEMLIARVSGPNDRPWVTTTLALGNVVCTPALKLWHTHTTLTLIYADAYFSQLNDRYRAKRDQFREKAKWAREKLMQLGLGVASSPVPQGNTPEVEPAPGGSLPGGTYFVTMAWTNASGEEGQSAIPAAVTTTLSSFVVRPGTAPATAAAWNIYVGSAPEAMTRQNQIPIALEQPWQQTAVPGTGGPGPSDGQAPSYIQQIPFVFQRG